MPELLAQQVFPELEVSSWLQSFVDDVLLAWFGWLWSILGDVIRFLVRWVEFFLVDPPLPGFLPDGSGTIVVILAFTAIAYAAGRWPLALFTFVAFAFVDAMGLFPGTMRALSLTLIATIFAAGVGVPLGIWAARRRAVSATVRPVLDFMQTMPPFVYLIPAAIFFGLGKVPGAIATLIFAMPPAVRLTNLGIRQVGEENIEAGLAFGCTPRQLLFKVQLPLAMPSIMAGVNQTIMLALSMVVIASMIGAGGLGNTVLTGIQRLDVGLGFEGGLGVVLLAILLDRITQSFGQSARQSARAGPFAMLGRLLHALLAKKGETT
jgi:glycine betaine/proline transport system permease protein